MSGWITESELNDLSITVSEEEEKKNPTKDDTIHISYSIINPTPICQNIFCNNMDLLFMKRLKL